MTIRWQRELPQWVLLWGMFALAAFSWDAVPETLPVHWNLAGDADRYGGKLEALLAFPLIALVTYVLLLLAPRVVGTGLEQLGSLYTGIRFGIVLLLTALYVMTVLGLLGYPIDMTRGATILVGATLEAVGSVMGRVRPNPVMGIRTPWTLTSEASWTASQRWGGRLFMVVGALLMLGGLTGLQLVMLGGIGVLLVGMVVLIWYGYRVNRNDPHRLPKGQTLLTVRNGPSPAADRQASADRSEGRARQRPGGRRRKGPHGR